MTLQLYIMGRIRYSVPSIASGSSTATLRATAMAKACAVLIAFVHRHAAYVQAATLLQVTARSRVTNGGAIYPLETGVELDPHVLTVREIARDHSLLPEGDLLPPLGSDAHSLQRLKSATVLLVVGRRRVLWITVSASLDRSKWCIRFIQQAWGACSTALKQASIARIVGFVDY